MHLIISSNNSKTHDTLDNFFDTQSDFTVEKQYKGAFYFIVSDQSDADATELALEEEINGLVNDAEELNYSFEIEDFF